VIETPPSGRPNVELRRQQILEAASACARLSGFHGASMAQIAQAAGLSVGQIYRYFENKEAIIAAIVAQDVAEMRQKFSELERSGQPLAEAIVNSCADAIDHNYDKDRAALRLEVLAEAARNPRVAEILRRADAEERTFKLEVLERTSAPGCGERELLARGEVLSMLFEGMVVRGVSNPDSDHAAISEVLRVVLRHLLTEAPCAPEGPPPP
jgi:AcrR family transcriptional regulator